ncbi:MAG: chemotaxis protein CheW [Anaerotignum sp.]
MTTDNNLNDEILGEDFLVSEANENLNKYLTFISANLTYGVQIEHVIEILTNPVITTLPMVPHYVTGIINLRGQILPIIDIREIMNKEICSNASAQCVIILEINSISIGILVDTVLQVVNLNKETITPPSKNLAFVNGMTNLSNDRVMFCLDCEALLENK